MLFCLFGVPFHILHKIDCLTIFEFLGFLSTFQSYSHWFIIIFILNVLISFSVTCFHSKKKKKEKILIKTNYHFRLKKFVIIKSNHANELIILRFVLRFAKHHLIYRQTIFVVYFLGFAPLLASEESIICIHRYFRIATHTN